MRIAAVLIVAVALVGGLALGPIAFASTDLSQVTAKSVRVRSVVRSTGGGVYVGGRSRSSRYSSGGGFSSGK